MLSGLINRRVLSWALYDWANSAFATVVMAGLFPVFFKQYWATGQSAVDSTFHLGLANGLASLLVVLMAPLLGALADQSGRRKGLLLLFTMLGVVMTGGLLLAAEGNWVMALALYLLAVLGFSGGNVFYDALLLEAAPRGRLDAVSGLGYALGYLGGGLLFGLCLLLIMNPGWLGLSVGEVVKLSFLLVAIWWAVFSVPLFLWLPEPQPRQAGLQLGAAFRELASTLRHMRRLPMTFLFLAAYWLYIDGVDTVIRMAVDYGLALGLDANALLGALLLTQFVGFPAALLFARLGERIGPRGGIFIALAVYAAVVLGAWRLDSSTEFYLLAVAIGLVQGGVQALSRSLYARMLPPGRSAEFFGLYNMLGKFAAVIGPVMVGWVGVLSNSPRAGILSLLLLFAAGALLLARVDVARGEADARRFG